MAEVEIRCKEIVECLSYFSKAVKLAKDYLCAGLFWTGDEEYIKNFSIILHKLIHNKENKDRLKDDFSNVLRNSSYRLKGAALYDRDRVIQRKSFKKNNNELVFPRFNKDKRINVISGKVAESETSKKTGLFFLRLVGMEEGVIDVRKLFEGRRKLIEIWENLSQNDYVKKHLAKVRRVGDVLYNIYPLEETDKIRKTAKLFEYMAGFDFKNFNNAILLSRAKLFGRKKKADELIKEIKDRDIALWEDVVYELKKKGINENEFLELLRKSEDKDFMKELRKDWKEVLKRMLSEKNEKYSTALVVKDNKLGSISYGEFLVPSNEIKLYLFYENSFKEEDVNNFIKGFEMLNKESSRFLGNMKMSIVKKAPIEKIIYNFEKLKNIYSSEKLKKNKTTILQHQDAVELLFGLMDFACRIRNFEGYMSSKKELLGILILLDTNAKKEDRKENDSLSSDEAEKPYPFWDYFKFIYNFFGVPVQTINRQTIDKIAELAKNKLAKNKKDENGNNWNWWRNRKKEKNENLLVALYKNLTISLLKDYKALRFDFEGFNLPQELLVYVILEKPSAAFCYTKGEFDDKGLRHFLYEVYKIDIEQKTAKIELINKWQLLASKLDIDRERFRFWLESKIKDDKTRFCFITKINWENSYLTDLINLSDKPQLIREKSLFVEYKELPTAYISEKSQNDCFVIHTSEFEKLKANLGIKNNDNSAVLAIKPVEPIRHKEFELDDGEAFYHQPLQVFSTKSPGWEENEGYLEKKSLFLFTMIALSSYESESFQTPYSKIDLWQKESGEVIEIKRDSQEYRLPISAVIHELVYLVNKIPSAEEKIKEK